MIELSTIKPNPKNPRQISQDEKAKLKDSINGFEKMMKANPIVIDENNVILSGNQRYDSLLELGYTSVSQEWVKKVDDFTEKEKKEFMVKMNTHNGSFDYEAFEDEYWEDVQFEEWLESEPDNALNSEKHLKAKEDNYKVPDVIQTDIVKGDLFEFVKGDLRHRLLCGDSTNVSDVEKLMDGEKAELVLTDPPYGISLKYVGVMANNTEGSIVGDDKRFNPATIFALEAKDYFIFGADYFIELLPNRKSLSVWAKAHTEQENNVFGASFETFWRSNTQKREIWYELAIRGGGNRFHSHPTEKPIRLIKRAIESFDHKLIVDLFSGSFTTMQAAHQLQRICYGMELDEKYCQVGVDRMLSLDPEIQLFRNAENVTVKYRKRLENL